MRSLVRGRYLVALRSRLQLQLFSQSQSSSTLRSLAHTTTHENTIAHQSRPRAKLRLRMDVGAALARPAIVLDTRYGAVRIPHERLPVVATGLTTRGRVSAVGHTSWYGYQNSLFNFTPTYWTLSFFSEQKDTSPAPGIRVQD